MAANFAYFDFHNIPCRITRDAEGNWGDAEIYQRGEGFVPGPKTDILYHGVPVSRDEFNTMVLEHTRPARD